MSVKPDNYKSPNDSTAIELDPNNDGNIVQKAFVFESLLNLTVLPLVSHTHAILSYVLNDPSQITPATILFARTVGGLTIGALTPALWAGVPNTKNAIESRRTVYITLGLGEVFLIPLLALEAMKGGGGDAALSVKACWMGIASLAPLLAWRGYVLFLRPELMGKYKEVKRE